jgi:gamma-glutamyltranspeptidase/glutathione hydrolase
MPSEGWGAVTVPGAVSGWAALSTRFGVLPFEQLVEPAVEYARAGFPVSPVVARQWEAQLPRVAGQPGFAAAFLRGGRAPGPGDWFQFPDQATTLDDIGRTRGESFYRGRLAERIVAFSAASDHALTLEDLASHQADWVDPIAQRYRGYGLHEVPPNGQGIGSLIALGILEHFDLGRLEPDSADSVHLQVEAMKLAFADVYRHVADPRAMEVPWSELLDPSYLEARAASIREDRARQPVSGPHPSGTVYLTAADAAGMMVSFIQSNFWGFGSGIVVPGTGISLQNRGAGFSITPGHPNVVEPGKRPFHTIIPAFITRAGRPVASFGVMGGDMQPQGHVQMAVRLIDHGQNPQAAIDAPRWKIAVDGTLLLEPGAERVGTELEARGHVVRIAPSDSLDFGAAQMIYQLDRGYLAASESRRDGQAVGF